MNIEIWRTYLYPLGFIASLAFSLRFLFQWISSERKKTSEVTPLFWKLSLLGNVIMTLHSIIQVQYPFTLIQTINALLAWRNLNLMQKREKHKTLLFTLGLMLFSLLSATLLFIIEGLYLYGYLDWVRTPTLPWEKFPGDPISLPWHIMGFIGALIFAMRFWIQWWLIEKHKRSYLGKTFWWFSIIGAVVTLVYCIRLEDWVNILGYGMGLIPYIRNLVLLNQKEAMQTS